MAGGRTGPARPRSVLMHMDVFKLKSNSRIVPHHGERSPLPAEHEAGGKTCSLAVTDASS